VFEMYGAMLGFLTFSDARDFNQTYIAGVSFFAQDRVYFEDLDLSLKNSLRTPGLWLYSHGIFRSK
jgi:hypothetical protein